MRKHKRVLIVLSLLALYVFGISFKTLVDNNNRNKELARQMQSKSLVDHMADYSEAKTDQRFNAKYEAAEKLFDKSKDVGIGGVVTNIKGRHVVVRMDTADGSTYYDVEIPPALKTYMRNIDVDCIVEMIVTINGDADGMFQAEAKKVKVTKRAGE